MCLNAMVFNTNGDEYWREAQRFFLEVQQMFKNQKRKSHASAYGFEAEQLIAQHNEELEAAKASKAKKRKATSSSLSSGAAGGASGSNANGTASAFDAELAKLGGDPSRGAAGSSKRSKVSSEFGTSSVTSEVLSESNNTDMIETASLSNGQSHDLSGAQLPKSNPTPPEKNLFLNENVLVPVDLAPSPDPSSFLPCTVVSHSIEEAYFLMCQEACLVCGSSGRAELMLYCVDCGEAVHSFCSDAPLSLMSEEARAGWRCMNCKICKCCNVGSENEALGKLLYCEGCDEAFHSKCVTPVVQTIPENSWFCGGCVKCRTCESDHTAVRDSSNSKTAPWGFDLSQCYPCAIREVITKAQAEAVQRARNLPSNCNVCYQPVCAPSVMCTACGRHSHVTCNPATALPVMSNDLENYRDFLCKVCVNQFLPACTSHIGSGEAATALLVAVARIQRVRRAQRQAMQAQSIKALAAERRVVFDSYRLVFRAVIHLATVRLRWFSEATGIVKSPTASAGPPTVKMFPNYLSGRSLRFLSFYKRRLEGSAESLRIRRERLLMGLDQETGLEMSSERLVRVASLAAAFLQCTGPDMNMFVSRAQEFVPTISFLEGLYGSAQNAELAQESILKFIASIGDIGKHSVKASSSGGGSSSVASTACSASNNGSMSDVTSVRPEGCALPTPVNVTAPSVAPSATDQSQFNHIVSHFLEVSFPSFLLLSSISFRSLNSICVFLLVLCCVLSTKYSIALTICPGRPSAWTQAMSQCQLTSAAVSRCTTLRVIPPPPLSPWSLRCRGSQETSCLFRCCREETLPRTSCTALSAQQGSTFQATFSNLPHRSCLLRAPGSSRGGEAEEVP